MADEVIYNDPTPNNFPNDYNKSQVDSRVALRSDSVKHKMKGHDVREGIYQSMEISSVVAGQADKKSTNAEKISKDTQNRFNVQINGQDYDNESKDARYSPADNKTYKVLTDRLNAMDKKPQQAVDNLQIGGRNLVLSSADNSHIGITDNRYKVFKLSVDEMNSKIFTVSTYLKDIENTDGVSIGLSMANPNDGMSYVDADIVKIGSNSYASGVIDLSGISNYKDYNCMIIYSGKGDWAGSDGKAITSYNRQVEKGNKATDWTPAPEDSHHHQAFRMGTRFFAHRGAQSIAPENSRPAIQKAGNHAGVEIDIHTTADGRWVVMHDGTVNRTTDGSGAISSFTFADLRKLKLKDPSNSRIVKFNDSDLVIPTLEEALIECKNRQLIPVIEIKVDGTDKYTSDDYDQLINIIKRFGVEDEMMFISFDYQALQEVKRRMPLVEVSYLVHTINSDLMAQAQQLGVNSGLDSNYTAAGVTANNVARCHNMGLKVGVWTFKDDSQRNKFINMGVDFITTNSLSGERRFAELQYKTGYNHYVKNEVNYKSIVQETAPSEVNVQFIAEAKAAKKGDVFATLPDWAAPNYRLWNICLVRISGGVTPGTFDIEGNNIKVGFNWDKMSGGGWVTGNVTYHV